jgi:hypothetical protein
MELADMVVAGSRGKSPYDDQARTRAMERTASTRVLASGQPTARTIVAAPAPRTRPHTQRPREVPANRPPAPAPVTAPERAHRDPRGEPDRRIARRIGLALAVLVVFVVVIVVVAVLASDNSSTVVHYQKVVANGAQSAIDQVQDIISKYTKG